MKRSPQSLLGWLAKSLVIVSQGPVKCELTFQDNELGIGVLIRGKPQIHARWNVDLDRPIHEVAEKLEKILQHIGDEIGRAAEKLDPPTENLK